MQTSAKMVSAMHGTEPTVDSGAAASEIPSLDALTVRVYRSPEPIERDWRRIASASQASVYQSFDWIDCWLRTVAVAQAIEPAIATLDWNGRILAIFPFGVEKVGPVRAARMLGDEHANIRMPLLDPILDPSPAAAAAAVQRCLVRIAEAIGKVDWIDFDAMPVEWRGRANFLARHPAAEPALIAVPVIALEPDFKAVLAAHRGAKKSKKHRWQINALAPVGGYRLRRATSEAEANEMLEAFLAEKAAWFRKMGMADRFAAPGIADFFRALIRRRWSDGVDVIDLDAIEFDGAIRAILGSGTANGRQSGYFLSIADDAWRRISPGELLLHDVIAASCGRQVEELDLGRGEERYKTSWLDRSEAHVRLLVPITIRGRAAVAILRAIDRLERTVRGNPTLWRLANAVRRLRGEAGEARDDKD